jgi:hypothetical protein
VAGPDGAAAPGAPAAFGATLFRWDEPSGWTFVRVPDEHAPDFAGAFGRVPVTATVDGTTWATSVWRDTSHGWLLAVPKKVRRGKDDGDKVTVSVEVDPTRI